MLDVFLISAESICIEAASTWWYAQSYHPHHQFFSYLAERPTSHHFVIWFKVIYEATVRHNEYVCLPTPITLRHTGYSTTWGDSN